MNKKNIVVALLALASGCATDQYTRYGLHNADKWGVGSPGIIGEHTLICANTVEATSDSSPQKEYVTATGRVLLKPYSELPIPSDAQPPIITVIRCQKAVCTTGTAIWDCTGCIRAYHPDGSFENLEADRMWFEVKGSYFTIISARKAESEPKH